MGFQRLLSSIFEFPFSCYVSPYFSDVSTSFLTSFFRGLNLLMIIRILSTSPLRLEGSGGYLPPSSPLRPYSTRFDVEYIYGFVRWGGLQTKSMTSQRAANKMADIRYYDNVMTTRWRLYVTMETVWQQQAGAVRILSLILHLHQYSHRLNLLYFILTSVQSSYLPEETIILLTKKIFPKLIYFTKCVRYSPGTTSMWPCTYISRHYAETESGFK